jgi:hypothetical protein
MKLMVNSLIKLGILTKDFDYHVINRTKRRLLWNHFKLTTSLRITM